MTGGDNLPCQFTPVNLTKTSHGKDSVCQESQIDNPTEKVGGVSESESQPESVVSASDFNDSEPVAKESKNTQFKVGDKVVNKKYPNEVQVVVEVDGTNIKVGHAYGIEWVQVNDLSGIFQKYQ